MRGKGVVTIVSMNNQRPDVTDEEIGMRAFQIRKGRAVERAMDRLREGLRGEWAQFTMNEVEAIGWVLGELWAYKARDEWEELHFSKLSSADVRSVLLFAREITGHSRNSVDVLNDVYDLIVSKS